MRLFQHYISLPSLLFTPIVKICTLDIDGLILLLPMYTNFVCIIYFCHTICIIRYCSDDCHDLISYCLSV